jgi:hypothetical protein
MHTVILTFAPPHYGVNHWFEVFLGNLPQRNQKLIELDVLADPE